MIAKEIFIEQGSSEWLALRKDKIGSSDAAAIMGVSKWNTPYSLWCEKLDLVPGKTENAAMRRGKDLEPEARQVFECLTGINVTPKVFIKDFMISSFDGVSKCNTQAVEIKCPGIMDHQDALNGNIPAHYYPQLQHQMMVLGLKKMFYFSFVDKKSECCILTVEKDRDYCEKLLDKEKMFWQYVYTLQEPPLIPKDVREITDSEHIEKAIEWDNINNQIKYLSERQEELRSQLISLWDGTNIRVGGVSVKCSVRKGSVDYDKIPELRNVDLEKYRKNNTKIWNLRRD